jgi:hypothetical protein
MAISRVRSAVRGEQATQVSAGGEQHDPRQPHHSSQKTACWRAEKIPEEAGTNQLESNRLVILGILFSHADSNRVQLRLRLGRGHTVLEAHNREDILLVALVEPIDSFERCLIGHGYEDVRLQKFFRSVEAFRGNTDDGVRQLVNPDHLSHDVGVCAKQTLPRSKGKHRTG